MTPSSWSRLVMEYHKVSDLDLYVSLQKQHRMNLPCCWWPPAVLIHRTREDGAVSKAPANYPSTTTDPSISFYHLSIAYSYLDVRVDTAMFQQIYIYIYVYFDPKWAQVEWKTDKASSTLVFIKCRNSIVWSRFTCSCFVFVLSLVFPERIFYLCAKSGVEADEWIKILRWKIVSIVQVLDLW